MSSVLLVRWGLANMTPPFSPSRVWTWPLGDDPTFMTSGCRLDYYGQNPYPGWRWLVGNQGRGKQVAGSRKVVLDNKV